jgi:hypothetical protein
VTTRWAIALLMTLLPNACLRAGSYCAPAYPSYSTYSYPTTYSYSSHPVSYSAPASYQTVYKEVPYYKEYPVYKDVPVARYVDIYPIYGQLYFGPGSSAAYAQAVNAAAKADTATTAATAASATASATSKQLDKIQSDLGSVLSGIKTLAEAQQATNNRLNNLEGRLQFLERKVGGGAPGDPTPPAMPRAVAHYSAPPAPTPAAPPVPMTSAEPSPMPGDVPGAGAPSATPTLPDALTVLRNKCALCHQAGNEHRAGKGKLVLLLKEGARAPLSGDDVAAMTTRLTEGSMPPPAPRKVKEGDREVTLHVAPLTNVETLAMLMDLKSFPRKKE